MRANIFSKRSLIPGSCFAESQGAQLHLKCQKHWAANEILPNDVGYDTCTLMIQHVYLVMDMLIRCMQTIHRCSMMALLPSFLTPFHGAMNAGSRAHGFSSITSPWTWIDRVATPLLQNARQTQVGGEWCLHPSLYSQLGAVHAELWLTLSAVE